MRLAHRFQGQTVKTRDTGGRGHTVSAQPGGHTACLYSLTVQLTWEHTKPETWNENAYTALTFVRSENCQQ